MSKRERAISGHFGGLYDKLVMEKEKIQKWYYTALEFCARRRQANQEQAKQARLLLF